MKISLSNLKRHLDTQLRFIHDSCAQFDSGFEEEAQRLALHARILLHDTSKSTSLLKQLDAKSKILFPSSVDQFVPTNLVKYSGLLTMQLCGTGRYIPKDEPNYKWIHFDDWWDELVVKDNKYVFSRKDIILMISNKDGGAHIQDTVDEVYSSLSYNNSLGWKYSDGITEYDFINNAAYATMRQISNEILLAISTHRDITRSSTVIAGGHFASIYSIYKTWNMKESVLYFVPGEVENDPIGSKIFFCEYSTLVNKKRVGYEDVTKKDGSTMRRIIII